MKKNTIEYYSLANWSPSLSREEYLFSEISGEVRQILGARKATSKVKRLIKKMEGLKDWCLEGLESLEEQEIVLNRPSNAVQKNIKALYTKVEQIVDAAEKELRRLKEVRKWGKVQQAGALRRFNVLVERAKLVAKKYQKLRYKIPEVTKNPDLDRIG